MQPSWPKTNVRVAPQQGRVCAAQGPFSGAPSCALFACRVRESRRLCAPGSVTFIPPHRRRCGEAGALSHTVSRSSCDATVLPPAVPGFGCGRPALPQRHCFASMLITGLKLDVETVSRQLGHSGTRARSRPIRTNGTRHAAPTSSGMACRIGSVTCSARHVDIRVDIPSRRAGTLGLERPAAVVVTNRRHL
jgi:hypothetical protein